MKKMKSINLIGNRFDIKPMNSNKWIKGTCTAQNELELNIKYDNSTSCEWIDIRSERLASFGKYTGDDGFDLLSLQQLEVKSKASNKEASSSPQSNRSSSLNDNTDQKEAVHDVEKKERKRRRRNINKVGKKSKSNSTAVNKIKADVAVPIKQFSERGVGYSLINRDLLDCTDNESSCYDTDDGIPREVEDEAAQVEEEDVNIKPVKTTRGGSGIRTKETNKEKLNPYNFPIAKPPTGKVWVVEEEEEVDNDQEIFIPSVNFKVDQKVKALRRNGVEGEFFYFGVVTKVNENGTYDILFDDGDRKGGIFKEHIKDPEVYTLGQKVKAMWMRQKQFFKGVIVKVKDDGKYDVLYDDGDMEINIAPQYIKAQYIALPKFKEAPNSNSNNSKKSTLLNNSAYYQGNLSPRVRFSARKCENCTINERTVRECIILHGSNGNNKRRELYNESIETFSSLGFDNRKSIKRICIRNNSDEVNNSMNSSNDDEFLIQQKLSLNIVSSSPAEVKEFVSVDSWLEELELSMYKISFLRNNITLEKIKKNSGLSEDDLEKIDSNMPRYYKKLLIKGSMNL